MQERGRFWSHRFYSLVGGWAMPGEDGLLQVHTPGETNLAWKFQETSLVNFEGRVRDGLVEKTSGVRPLEGEMLFSDNPPATTR